MPADNVGALFTDAFMSSTQSLSVGQQFEVERFSRAIDATADPEQLKALAKQLLQAWHTQKAATEWAKSHSCNGASHDNRVQPCLLLMRRSDLSGSSSRHPHQRIVQDHANRLLTLLEQELTASAWP